MGTKGRFAASRAWALYTKDRAVLKDSVQELLEWDIARVIAAHGDVVDSTNAGPDVREATRHALGRLLR